MSTEKTGNTKDTETKVVSKKKPTVKKTKLTKDKRTIDELKQQISVLEDKHLRLKAEFDNFRRRKERDFLRMLEYEGLTIFESLLPLIDDLDRLVEACNTQNDKNDSKSIKEGVELIRSKMDKFLSKWNVEPFGKTGEILNADIHDAMLVKQEEGKEDDEILQVFQKGYQYKDRVIRHAKVIVNKI